MLTRHSGFQKFVALLGLCAVLLGALEHEDLILQDAREIARLAPAGVQAAQGEAALAMEGVDKISAESGTEGTFRSEQYRFWLSPRQSGHYARVPKEARWISRRSEVIATRTAVGRPSRMGIVALRL